MALDSLFKLNALERKKDVSGIAGLSKIDGRIYDDRAERDTGFSKYNEQLFRDQLLTGVRTLQYYNQLGSKDRLACSLQRSALQALYTIYSFKLNPVGWSEASDLETLLLIELLQIINRPYEIHAGSSDSGSETRIDSPAEYSPTWELHDLALRLTRVLIDCNRLSGRMLKVAENHLTNLMEKICSYQLERLTCERVSGNVATLAHCLYRLSKKNGYEESSQRRLLSLEFFYDHLFPLACKFAATEYPATIVDPISHYELFESTGKLKEPDEVLAEWNKRNATKDISSKSGDVCRRDLSGHKLDDNYFRYDAHPLPPSHVCLMYLMYKLSVSSNGKNRNALNGFLEQKILAQDDTNHDSETNSFASGIDSEASKLALINRIVALNLLLRDKLHPQSDPDDKSKLLCELLFSSFQEDCLLMKICKFQLLQPSTIIDAESGETVLHAYVSEFIKIKDIEDFQDQKLLLIFAAVASESLYYIQDEQLCSLLLNTYLGHLDRKSQLNLVKKITILNSDYKIRPLLELVRIVLCNNRADETFLIECDRHLTKVIDSLASQILVLLSAKDKFDKNYKLKTNCIHLLVISHMRFKPLPDETVEKLLKVAKICIFEDISRFHHGCGPFEVSIWNGGFLKCALKFPLNEQAQVRAINLLDQILEKFFSNKMLDSFKWDFLTIVLENYGLYQAMSLSPPPSTSNSQAANKNNENEKHNLLFESPERIMQIYLAFKLTGHPSESSSCCILSTLMSWPSSPASFKANMDFGMIWRRFIELTIEGLERLKARHNGSHIVETRNDLIFALMAAFNHDQALLKTYLDELESPRNKGGAYIKKHIGLWLNFVIRRDDVLWLKHNNDDASQQDFDYHVNRSHVHISYVALNKIHEARAVGKLVFPIKKLIDKLNSARRIVLKWLAELDKQAIASDSPLGDYYAGSIRQLETIGAF